MLAAGVEPAAAGDEDEPRTRGGAEHLRGRQRGLDVLPAGGDDIAQDLTVSSADLDRIPGTQLAQPEEGSGAAAGAVDMTVDHDAAVRRAGPGAAGPPPEHGRVGRDVEVAVRQYADRLDGSVHTQPVDPQPDRLGPGGRCGRR